MSSESEASKEEEEEEEEEVQYAYSLTHSLIINTVRWLGCSFARSLARFQAKKERKKDAGGRAAGAARFILFVGVCQGSGVLVVCCVLHACLRACLPACLLACLLVCFLDDQPRSSVLLLLLLLLLHSPWLACASIHSSHLLLPLLLSLSSLLFPLSVHRQLFHHSFC